MLVSPEVVLMNRDTTGRGLRNGLNPSSTLQPSFAQGEGERQNQNPVVELLSPTA